MLQIEVLRVDESKCCIMFNYLDIVSKIDLPDSNEIIKHFKKSFRDHSDLKMFNDTTFEGDQEKD